MWFGPIDSQYASCESLSLCCINRHNTILTAIIIISHNTHTHTIEKQIISFFQICSSSYIKAKKWRQRRWWLFSWSLLWLSQPSDKRRLPQWKLQLQAQHLMLLCSYQHCLLLLLLWHLVFSFEPKTNIYHSFSPLLILLFFLMILCVVWFYRVLYYS